MTLYTTQAPDGSSGLICSSGELSVWHRLLQTREKSVGDRDPGGIGISMSLQESFYPRENMIQAKLPRSGRAQDRNMLRRASGEGWAGPGNSISLYTSFSMSWKLLSTHPDTGKLSIWRTHAPVSQITLAGDFFCSLEKESSFETLIKR